MIPVMMTPGVSQGQDPCIRASTGIPVEITYLQIPHERISWVKISFIPVKTFYLMS
jgi:hypothetical protein